jgi:enoyl-CoA hydratase/carnithine racemase
MPDILVTKRNSVAVVSLNRPQVRNAMTLGMWRELASIFSSMANDHSVRAVVLATSGKDFCVGADVTEFDLVRKDNEQSAAYEVSVDDCSTAIANLPKTVIAAISGYCLGGGCHLALACDFSFCGLYRKVRDPRRQSLDCVWREERQTTDCACRGRECQADSLFGGALRCRAFTGDGSCG